MLAATGAEVLSESVGADTQGEAGRRALEATCRVKVVYVGLLAADGRMLEKESADWVMTVAMDTGSTISVRIAFWAMTRAAATGPSSSGKCALVLEVADTDLTSSSTRALEPGAAATRREPSPEEPVPVETRDKKYDQIGSSMTLNFEKIKVG
jgi:hypothetical protein